jgi:hypothetical protein
MKKGDPSVYGRPYDIPIVLREVPIFGNFFLKKIISLLIIKILEVGLRTSNFVHF